MTSAVAALKQWLGHGLQPADPASRLRALVDRSKRPAGAGQEPPKGSGVVGPPWDEPGLHPQRGPQTAAPSDEALLGLEKGSGKLDLRGLTDKAQVGEPAPEMVPSDDQLRKMAAAARLGLSSPPEASPGGLNASARGIAKWLVSFTQRSTGDLLLWRATPCGVLNELFQVASLGTDDSFFGDEGMKVGMQHSSMLRERAYRSTRAEPLSKDVASFPDDLLKLEDMWRGRNEGTVLAARRALAKGQPLDLGDLPGEQAAGSQAGGGVCLWFALRKRTQKSCKRAHTCPFCAGTDCCSKEGYLAWHLGQLKNPRSIVLASPAQPPKPEVAKRADRSRSPRRARGSGSGRASDSHQGRGRSPQPAGGQRQFR